MSVRDSPDPAAPTTGRGLEKEGWSFDGEIQLLGGADLEPRPQATLATRFVLEPDGAPSAQPTAERSARANGYRMATGGLESAQHRHREAQLLYVERGEVTCEAAGAWSIVPPNAALWIPGDVDHRVRARAPLEGYNVYLEPGFARNMRADCAAVAVTPLFREVVLRLAQHRSPYDADGPAAHLVTVLLDEVAALPMDEHRLPMPSDPRLQRLVAMMTASPADTSDTVTWARRIGVAERTLSRLIVAQTGLSFGRWRQQLHIVLSIQRMARGASVQAVASELGYETASSFVTMFRKALGKPPARYMAERGAATPDQPALRRRDRPR